LFVSVQGLRSLVLTARLASEVRNGTRLATSNDVRSLWMLVMPLALSIVAAPDSAAQHTKEPVIPVVDLRVGLAEEFQNPARNFWQGAGQGGIIQLRQGHVVGVVVPISPPRSESSAEQLAIRFARFRSAFETTQVFDIRACTPSYSRLSTWFELEAPELLAGDPKSTATWVARGVRVVALTGRRDSALATSAFPSGEPRVVGLSAVGRSVAEAAIEAGALIDVANLSDAAVLEVLELARTRQAPVIATSGSARAVLRRPGSYADWQLRGIAESGGVIGLSFDRDLIGAGGGADLADLLRHLDHLLRVAGPDAIALASGFETRAIPTNSVKSAARYPRLVEALHTHGLSFEQIRKIFYGNAWRVLCGRSAVAK
jgi:membrane dipeptidase